MSVKKIKKAVMILFVLIIFSQNIFCQNDESLKNLGEKAGKLIGYATQDYWERLYKYEEYLAIAKREFNIVTPENSMKMDALQPSQNNFNFSAADKVVKFALENNIKVHGHCLIWHSAPPSWISASRNRETLIKNGSLHIEKVLEHFKGKIWGWDVVNEAFNENGSLRPSFWYQTIGAEYFDSFYQKARETDPDAKLIYNDYNIAEIGPKSDGVYLFLKNMLERDIPIDAIGIQMHLTEEGIDYESFARNMSRFAELGLEIWITEMDVRIHANSTEENYNKQADIYRQVLAKVMAEPACTVFQVWGITDRYTWVPNTFPGTDNPLLWDDEYNPKPAFFAVQEELAKGTSLPTPTPVPADIDFAFSPDVIECETFNTTQFNLTINSRKATVANYNINIHYDPSYLKPDQNKGIVQAAHEGFFTADMYSHNGIINIAGFNISGINPGSNQEFLKINFVVKDRSGITRVYSAPGELLDLSGNALDGNITESIVSVNYVKQCPIPGDGNKDGELNIVDALLAAQVYVGLDLRNVTEVCLDFDDDGKVTIIDALLIAQAYVAPTTP